jgi:uncharacterized protein involved in exopolysaccharide biosynthesis
LRSRWWIAAGVFVATSGAVAAWAFCQPKIYSASAMIQVLGLTTGSGPFSHDPLAPPGPDASMSFREASALAVKIAQSPVLVQRVMERMSVSRDDGDDSFRRFMAPYQAEAGRSGPEPSLSGILERNRRIIAFPNSLLIGIEYRHPDRHVAATVANLFSEELVVHCNPSRSEETPANRAQPDVTSRQIREMEVTLVNVPREIRLRPISHAVPAREDEYVAPRIPLVLFAGAALGFCLALSCGLPERRKQVNGNP